MMTTLGAHHNATNLFCFVSDLLDRDRFVGLQFSLILYARLQPVECSQSSEHCANAAQVEPLLDFSRPRLVGKKKAVGCVGGIERMRTVFLVAPSKPKLPEQDRKFSTTSVGRTKKGRGSVRTSWSSRDLVDFRRQKKDSLLRRRNRQFSYFGSSKTKLFDQDQNFLKASAVGTKKCHRSVRKRKRSICEVVNNRNVKVFSATVHREVRSKNVKNPKRCTFQFRPRSIPHCNGHAGMMQRELTIFYWSRQNMWPAEQLFGELKRCDVANFESCHQNGL